MDARVPAEVGEFFTHYLDRFHAVLPDVLQGCYLYGSIALGAFNPVRSDIDFLAVLAHPLDAGELQTLDHLHRRLNRAYPLARRLEGQYVPLVELQCDPLSKGYVSYAQGKYLGVHPVMTLYWYQLYTAGVCVAGPAPETLFPPISWELVQQEMARNINHYWLPKARTQQVKLLSNTMVEFAVLTLCRIFYTLEYRQILSKEAAGHWALTALPAIWRPLIHEALRLRAGVDRRSHYPTRWQRMRAVQQFIEAMVAAGNTRFFANIGSSTTTVSAFRPPPSGGGAAKNSNFGQD